jgi:uncharacterized membrane protein
MLGVGLGLAAGVIYAIYTWVAHRLIGRGVTPRAAMGAVFGMGGLLLLPVLLATGAPLAASWPNAAAAAYMALIPMFTGYLLFGWALGRVPASTATTLSLLEPAIATILAVMVVGERLPAAGWAGLTLIAGCLVLLTAPWARFSPAGVPRATQVHQEAVPARPRAQAPRSRRKPARRPSSLTIASSTPRSIEDAPPLASQRGEPAELPAAVHACAGLPPGPDPAPASQADIVPTGREWPQPVHGAAPDTPRSDDRRAVMLVTGRIFISTESAVGDGLARRRGTWRTVRGDLA